MSTASGRPRWVGNSFAAIGVLLLGVSAWLVVEHRRFATAAQRVDGIVTRLERNPGGRSGTFHAFVQFRDGDRTVEVRSRTASSPPAFAVGEAVTVLYEPGRADQARIEAFSEQYLLVSIFGGLGMVFTAVGLGILFFSRRGGPSENVSPTPS